MAVFCGQQALFADASCRLNDHWASVFGGSAMRKVLVQIAVTIGAGVTVAGCASAISQQTYTATGSIGHNIDCSGVARSWADCEQKAGDLCKAAGYEVLSKTDERRQASITGETAVGDLFSPNKVARSLVVQCREPGSQPVQTNAAATERTP